MRRSFVVIVSTLCLLLLAYFAVPIVMPRHNLVPIVATKQQGFILATGSIEARDDVVLAFEGGGVVRDVEHVVGDLVQAGDVIVSLDAGTLRADVEAQRLRVQKEGIRLGSFKGPEEKERAQIDASVAVAERQAESKTHIALTSAQQIAGEIENMIRTEVDVLFENPDTNPRLTSKHISVDDRRSVSQTRSDFEQLFAKWRTWSGVGSVSHARVSGVLREFESDLRYMHGGIVTFYDTLLQYRGLSDENNQAFLLITNVRSELLKHTVAISQHAQSVSVAHAERNLARAQSDRQLSGGTEADRLAQSAQVDVEREQLRRLELQLAKTQIRAPFSGVIGDIFVQQGEFVAAGAGAVRLVSQGGFDLSVDVTEVDVQNVAVGQDMVAEVEATGEELTATVRTISEAEKRVDDVPVYTVTFDLAESDTALRPGMTVDVQVPTGDPMQAFIVPRSALVSDGGTHSVSVQRGGVVISVEVMVGSTVTGDHILVTGEFQDGDLVIDEKGR
ncbi:MAG: efflux RND transporter periplasmic adaptor subunit [Candidatus Kaiserbacteria bacterium]|nr:efflux RND transporter periplasmic adaptor subunit [Candidatus Kaiserbacteria bacterium]